MISVIQSIPNGRFESPDPLPPLLGVGELVLGSCEVGDGDKSGDEVGEGVGEEGEGVVCVEEGVGVEYGMVGVGVGLGEGVGVGVGSTGLSGIITSIMLI